MKNSFFYPFIFFLFAFVFQVHSQEKIPRNSAEILHALKQFEYTGRVLYIAAHPDDENTRLITYLVNEDKATTAYLSLTRGDGGQNLIGNEQNAYLGLIRTHELMEARKLDGGKQYFTRAVDFGFSKSPEETLELWDKNEVLSDVVFIIRKFQPDVIVNRFPPNSMAGHGHHSASAILAAEAFDLAADSNAFPEQLKYVKPWQAHRMYFNTSSWWIQNIAEEAEKDGDYLKIDVGKFNPLLGKWYTELAAESRSMHKSQGFGAAKLKGSQMEYLQYVKGQKAEKNLFEDVDLTWRRYSGGDAVEPLISKAISSYNFENPEELVPQLLNIYNKIDKLQFPHKEEKLRSLQLILMGILGLEMEAIASQAQVSTGETVKISFQSVHQSALGLKLLKVSSIGFDSIADARLERNKLLQFEKNIPLPADYSLSQPFWLTADANNNLFPASTKQQIGLALNEAAVEAHFTMRIQSSEIVFKVPVIYKWVDRVEGEKEKNLSVCPPITLNLDKTVYVSNNEKTITVKVLVKNQGNATQCKVSLNTPKGWKMKPKSADVKFSKTGEIKELEFTLEPGKNAEKGQITAEAVMNGKLYDYSEKIITYNHIEQQILFPKSAAQVAAFPLESQIQKIGYFTGAGDDIPDALRLLGIQVDILEADKIPSTNFKQYPCIVLGIRALNTDKKLAEYYPFLMEYVKQGGTLIVQYLTNRDILVKEVGPYPLKVGRERVTEENASTRRLIPGHDLFQFPNKIEDSDFDFWIQERGLYFASEWDKAYEAPISWNDTGEPGRDGSILICNYGKGKFVYTGISFFRQLPAGVSGAYRLFVNMIHLNYKKV